MGKLRIIHDAAGFVPADVQLRCDRLNRLQCHAHGSATMVLSLVIIALDGKSSLARNPVLCHSICDIFPRAYFLGMP